MLKSHDTERDKFGMYRLFIERINEGEEYYKRRIDEVIGATTKLAQNSQNINSIPRGIFPIVIFLKQSDTEYFKRIEVHKGITPEVYNHVHELLGLK